jgi:collagenase-like PrtC family protease
MPADYKKETIDAYDSLNKSYPDSKVVETYGNITAGDQIGSGRAVSQLPESDLLDLKLFIEYSRAKNIGFNYTMNATHLQNKEFTPGGIAEITSFLRDLYTAGVRSITVALPSLFEIIRATGLDFSIKASTLCQITTANKAAAFKEKGVERMVADESLNRDFETLRRICRIFGDKVEVIVNPICLKDCVYRTFHYNEITSDSKGKSNNTSVNFYEHRCVMQRNAKVSNLLRMCFIRPEDIKYYTEIGIRYFKLQGRQQVLKGDAVKTVKAYMDESFEGDLMDLMYLFYSQNSFRIDCPNKKLDGFIKPFVSVEGFCHRDCDQCKYCDKFAERIIDYEKAGETIRAADKFYEEFDEFNQLKKNLEQTQTVEISNMEEASPNMDDEFDL